MKFYFWFNLSFRLITKEKSFFPLVSLSSLSPPSRLIRARSSVSKSESRFPKGKIDKIVKTHKLARFACFVSVGEWHDSDPPAIFPTKFFSFFSFLFFFLSQKKKKKREEPHYLHWIFFFFFFLLFSMSWKRTQKKNEKKVTKCCGEKQTKTHTLIHRAVLMKIYTKCVTYFSVW